VGREGDAGDLRRAPAQGLTRRRPPWSEHDQGGRDRLKPRAPTAAAAEGAGFRPCLRCRPEAAPGTPAWRGAAATVTRAFKLIDGGFLDDGKTVGDLADTLGMTSRHLSRLFAEHAGAPPSAVAATRRVQRAKRMVDETSLPMAAIAFAAGFRSIRRFNAAFRAVYRRPPRALRAARRR